MLGITNSSNDQIQQGDIKLFIDKCKKNQIALEIKNAVIDRKKHISLEENPQLTLSHK